MFHPLIKEIIGFFYYYQKEIGYFLVGKIPINYLCVVLIRPLK